MKLLISTIHIFLCATVFSQSMNMSPNTSFSQCPQEPIFYTVNNSVTNNCIFVWTVVNGIIAESGSTTHSGGNGITVTWANTTSSGQIKVRATNCDPVGGNTSADAVFVYAIRSINGVNPGTITNNSGGAATTAITVNTNASVTYKIPQVNFPNIGSAENPPKEVNSYEWQIPSGWSVVSGGTTKTITVQPDNCTGGTVRVRGVINSCTNGPFFSNWSNALTITRTIATPGAVSGQNFAVCTDVSSRSYSVASVTGATSYTWTLPSEWTGTSTSNSISVTPNGTNGGTISVKANGCSLQSSASSLPILLKLFNPASLPSITGDATVCYSGTTYYLQNLPAYASVSWTKSPGITYVSGQSTYAYSVKAETPEHANAGWVEALLTTPCGTQTIRYNVWVGVPLVDFINFSNNENEGMYFCSSSYGNYFELESSTPGANFQARMSDITGQTVLYTSPITYQANVPNLWSYYPSSNGYYIFETMGTNECGSTSWVGTEIEYIDCSEYGTLAIYPNPTASTLTVEKVKEPGGKVARSIRVEVTNSHDGALVFSQVLKPEELPLKINTSIIQNGFYLLKVIVDDRVEFKRIKIEH